MWLIETPILHPDALWGTPTRIVTALSARASLHARADGRPGAPLPAGALHCALSVCVWQAMAYTPTSVLSSPGVERKKPARTLASIGLVRYPIPCTVVQRR